MNLDPAEYEYPGTPLESSLVNTFINDSTGIGPQQQRMNKAPLWKKLTFWSVAFNCILMLTTIGLGLVAYWQLEATNEAVKISERTMQLAQRAYVSVQRLETRFEQQGVFLYLQNTGVIPADNIRIDIVESRIESKTLNTVRQHSIDLDLGHNFISKDSPYPVPIELQDFQAREIPRIMSGEERILIGGNVKFTDGVLSEEQTINFAYYFFPLGKDGIWLSAPVKSFAELPDPKNN